MKFAKHVIPMLAAVIATPVIAAESDVLPLATDQIEPYRNAGAWTIYENQTRKSCFAVHAGETTAVQLGLAKNKELGYIGVFAKGVDVSGGAVPVSSSLNNEVHHGIAGSATHIAGGYEGGYVLGDKDQLRVDLKKTNELIAFPDSPHAVAVDLSGSYDAVYEVRKCTEELEAD